MASVRTNFSRRRPAAERDRLIALRQHPVKVEVTGLSSVYGARQELNVQVSILPILCGLQAVEVSVLWATEGKGDADLGVHEFQRLLPTSPEAAIEVVLGTRLPNSPLSYRGHNLKINWKIALNIQTVDDHEFKFDFPFRLVANTGHEPIAKPF